MGNINRFTIKYIEKIKKFLLLIVMALGLLTTFLLNDSISIVLYILLFVVFYALNKKGFRIGKEFLVWRFYMAYTVFSCIIGLLFFAEIYFDYKALVFNFFGLILPVMLGVSFRDRIYFTLFYRIWLKWGVVLVLIMIPFIPGYQVGKCFTAILFFAIFFKDLTNKHKIFSIIIILIGLALNDGSRSVLIRSVLFVLIALCTYFPTIIRRSKKVIIILFFIPFYFLIAAIFFNFNIFEIGGENTEYTIKASDDLNGGTDGRRGLVTDTRSFLYKESLFSAINHQSMLFGRTPARGHDTVAFYGDGNDGTRRGERYVDEIGVLNIFNWFGIIGSILYSSCFLYSIWLGLYRSKNVYTIYGAIMLQFFWIYSWVEEIQVVRWDYLIIFLIVPFITSNSFRQMDNNEMKIFINGITRTRWV